MRVTICSSWFVRIYLQLCRAGTSSVVKHLTADQGIARLTPSLWTTKITKKEICNGSFQEKCSRVSVLYTGHVKEHGLPCVVGAPVSCTLALGPLIETNNLYAPTPNVNVR